MYAWTAVVAGAAVALAFIPVAYVLLLLIAGSLAVLFAALRPDGSREATSGDGQRTGTRG
jgi:hypothetical protein